MSLRRFAPNFFGRDWWDIIDYPERLMDQFFAMNIFEDDFRTDLGTNMKRRSQSSIADSGKSEIKNENDKFQIALNVKQFKPEEIEVKVVDNYVEIHGKHEEKSDKNGFVAREFTRRYMLPKACDGDTVNCSLSPDGMLKILAPKKEIGAPKKERKLPLVIEDKKSRGDSK
ncbi:alpha-crystallin A chain [Nephila pilipes]|uniref:Alpha-crystallin A chain n=1 Tax=Nephila pilipes TaxID=299642 RepID=A0A8X6ULK3_NEPPI|nr:alpha-crystallin A chain [Nephila pilipes]